MLLPVQPLVPVQRVLPPQPSQFDILASLIVTEGWQSAPAPAPVAPEQVPMDLHSDIVARMTQVLSVPDPVPDSVPENRADIAERRQTGLPSEDDMVIADSSPGPAGTATAPLPYMGFRLRDQLHYWQQIKAPKLVLSWVEHGYMGTFWAEPPKLRKKNQQSCYEPQEQYDFVASSVHTLLSRGVISEWKAEWGEPKVISPLKVVPKKPDTFRLILDLSEMNYYLSFPKFKYDHINQVRDRFRQGYFLFCWDLKDGYWHVDLHPDFWTYMVFEWEGKLYYWLVMPFGCAPACWVFTMIIRALISHCRLYGLKCLSYIDDGLGGDWPYEQAVKMSKLVQKVFVSAGFILNVLKSQFDPALESEFIGYRVNCTELWARGNVGFLAPTGKRLTTLIGAANRTVRSKKVSARKLAKLAGFIVSLRPVYDPAALLFTKDMYRWLQRLVDERGWDWYEVLSAEAKTEVQVWVDHGEEWGRKALWSTELITWVGAQDAGDAGVGGWVGKLGSCQQRTVTKRNRKGEVKVTVHNVWFPQDIGVEVAAAKLSAWSIEQSSTYREGCALEFILKTNLSRLAYSSVLLQADNKGLYFVLKKGSSTVPIIHSLAVRVFWMCYKAHISLNMAWIPRELNQWADDMSKLVDRDDWSVTAGTWQHIQSVMGPFHCDRFASESNHLLPLFCSTVHSPDVHYVEAFSRPWSGGKSWCHPAPRDVGAVIEKVREEAVTAALLLPSQTGSWWWLSVCPDGRHFSPMVKGKLVLKRHCFVAGEGSVPYSLRSGKAMVLDLDGAAAESDVWPVLGYCAVGGCQGCDWKGVL